MTDTDRLTLLEERYAHLQRHQAEQDRAMLELSEEIGRLRRELAVVRGQLTAEPAPGGPPAGEDRPPHY